MLLRIHLVNTQVVFTAFLNRFIELHFEELPEEELLIIVEKKCHLAEQGLLILTSRCRSQQGVQTIHSTIQTVFNKKINITNLDNPQTLCEPIMNELNKIIEQSFKAINESIELKNFVWTPTARRTALLVGQAYKFNEPFLLIGETGIGKTTICQILTHINHKSLHIMNCHMHSEAADFLGSIRPVRSNTSNQLFKWQDGPLVIALRQGQDFLIDEISLADDSVLERLNSVLEDDRTLLVAENLNADSALIVAHPQFRIFATMNPGGDFGKKELSAALRNRFTEIWCPTPNQDSEEFAIICQQKLNCSDSQLKTGSVQIITQFLKWLKQKQFFSKKSLTGGTISIRDLVRWIDFNI